MRRYHREVPLTAQTVRRYQCVQLLPTDDYAEHPRIQYEQVDAPLQVDHFPVPRVRRLWLTRIVLRSIDSVTYLIASCAPVLYIERAGRRKTLIGGAIGQCVCCVMLAAALGRPFCYRFCRVDRRFN
jgi:hypothetical protein